jgi:hypothetical protein
MAMVTVETKKMEVKTVDFDMEKAEKLMNIAMSAVQFPEYPGIREATTRMLRKMEQDLEEKLVKVHEEEAKALAEAEAKKAADAAKAAEAAAKGKAA